MYNYKLSEKKLIGLSLEALNLINRFNITKYKRKDIIKLLNKNNLKYDRYELEYLLLRISKELKNVNQLKLSDYQ